MPAGLAEATAQGLAIDPSDTTYFLGRETLVATRNAGMAVWREKLFVLMSRNATRATAFFKIPPSGWSSSGMQIEL